MRTLTLQMMTTLNGRLDDPGAWVSPITEDLYSEIDRVWAHIGPPSTRDRSTLAPSVAESTRKPACSR